METLILSPLDMQENNENVEIHFQITSNRGGNPICLNSKLQSVFETIFHSEHQLHTAVKFRVYILNIVLHAV